MRRASFSYSVTNDVAIMVIDTIDMHGCHNQNSHFNELDAGNDTANATDTV